MISKLIIVIVSAATSNRPVAFIGSFKTANRIGNDKRFHKRSHRSSWDPFNPSKKKEQKFCRHSAIYFSAKFP